MESEYYTVKEVARKLNVKDQVIRDWINDGSLEAIKVRGEFRISEKALERAIEESTVNKKPSHREG